MVPFLVIFTALASNCNSVGRPQVEAAVGRRLDPGTPEFTKLESTCTWSGGDISVTITVRYLTAPLDPGAELANLQSAFPGSTLREIYGLTERGFSLEIPGGGVQLHLLLGSREYVLVSVMGAGERSLAAALSLARSLLSHKTAD
jgi:hypothetical protein